MDFLEAVNRFLNYLRLAKGVSEHTLRGYRADLTSFEAAIARSEGAALPLGAVEKRTVRRYLAHLNETGVSVRTVLRHLSALRSLFRYAMREKLCSENPLEEIDSPKKDKRLPISITYDQVELLFAQPDVADRRLDEGAPAALADRFAFFDPRASRLRFAMGD